jgi:hypothetical protein
MRDAYRNEGRDIVRRSMLPPPQPIFVPETADGLDSDMPLGSSPPLGSPNSRPKRSKSLMQKIRKMRDSPNVPVSNDYFEAPPSPESPSSAENAPAPTGATGRPTHRSQNSFLGRFTRKEGGISPTLEEAPYSQENSRSQDKDLPATPYGAASPGGYGTQGYFDNRSPERSNNFGRKQSLLKKVGRVVRGTR